MLAGMRELSGDELLALPVRLHGIQLGRPTELFLDLDARRVVGLDVLCGDDVHRFLPLSAAVIDEAAIRIPSAFVLLEGDQLAFYRARAETLRALRERRVHLRDVVVGRGGELVALIVESDGRTVRTAA
jgi:hypothetical protein